MPLATLRAFEEAVAKISERAVRAGAALDQRLIPYEVIGGLAVGTWVAREDESAVRTTKNVDIALRRQDLDTAVAAISGLGFDPEHSMERVSLRERHSPVRGDIRLYTSTDVPLTGPRSAEGYRVASLDRLLVMKLTRFSRVDRVHLRDLLDVEAITPAIEATLPPDLLARLDEVKQDPLG
jgi:hypothetical protein